MMTFYVTLHGTKINLGYRLKISKKGFLGPVFSGSDFFGFLQIGSATLMRRCNKKFFGPRALLNLLDGKIETTLSSMNF